MSLNKILAAFYPIRVEGRRFYIQQALDWDFLCEADEVYEEFIDDNKFELLTRDQIKTSIIRRGIITPNIEKELQAADKQLSENKRQLFENRDNPVQVNKFRRRIATIRNTINSSMKIMAVHYRSSLEDSADYAKQQFILDNTIFDEDMQKASLADLSDVESYLLNPSIAEIRKIARSDPWKTLWMTKKGACFRYSPLTTIQLTLAQYSKFYENVYKSIDEPLYSIIDDDDMLDGWQIARNAEMNKEEKPQNAAQKHGHVIEFVKNKEELQALHDSNSPHAKNIIASRQKQIKQAGGKVVEHNQLSDVRMQNATRGLQR